MSQEKTIERALYYWLSGVTGLATIWYQQNAPRPQRPYAMLSYVTGQIKVGSRDELVQVSGDVYKTRGPRRQMIQIDIFGDVEETTDVFAVANDACNSLDDPMIVEQLAASGVAIIDEGQPRDLGAVRDTMFEPRSQFEITIGMTAERETRPGYIQSVILEGQSITAP